MPIDVLTPQSPGWWLMRCSRKLERRRKRIDPLFERYEGQSKPPPEIATAPDAAKRFYETSRTNFAEMVVKSVRYRMRVAAIQTARDSGEIGDVEAWAAWRQAGMVVEAPDAERSMLVAGDGYVLVSMYDGAVAATAEDPRQVVTIHDPVRQSRVRAWAKVYYDPDLETSFAHLGLPGRVWTAFQPGRRARDVRFSGSWE